MIFEDILYEVKNGVAWITINRPEKMNAFRGTTCDELIKALNKAGYDREVGAIVLTGAGDRAFCTGGDQSAHDGNYDGRGTIGLPMEELHTAMRWWKRISHHLRSDHLFRECHFWSGGPENGFSRSGLWHSIFSTCSR